MALEGCSLDSILEEVTVEQADSLGLLMYFFFPLNFINSLGVCSQQSNEIQFIPLRNQVDSSILCEVEKGNQGEVDVPGRKWELCTVHLVCWFLRCRSVNSVAISRATPRLQETFFSGLKHQAILEEAGNCLLIKHFPNDYKIVCPFQDSQ